MSWDIAAQKGLFHFFPIGVRTHPNGSMYATLSHLLKLAIVEFLLEEQTSNVPAPSNKEKHLPLDYL